MGRQTRIWSWRRSSTTSGRVNSTLYYFLFVDGSVALYPSFETGG
jgi:hypothetical protein